MTAKILDGRKLSAIIKDSIKQKIKQRSAPPGLDVILVGNHAASEIYVQHKQKACKEVGIRSRMHKLEITTQEQLLALINQLNEDSSVNGILLQLPLPCELDESVLLDAILPQKDVDGFHAYNLGRLMQRQPALRPCTPHGIIQLLDYYGIECCGKYAVIVGASNIVGRPLAMEFLLKKATITVCHRFTHDLKKFVGQADILVGATGNPDVIQSEWIKPGAVVIDVGITRLPDGKIIGDIDFETAKENAAWITPVPGGVGPMTVATLLQNTLIAAENT